MKARLRDTILAPIAAAAVAVAAMASAQTAPVVGEVSPGAPEVPHVDPSKAYLFAHMTKERYGVLYYSVSLDGLRWRHPVRFLRVRGELTVADLLVDAS